MYRRAFYFPKYHELFKNWRLLTTHRFKIARFVANSNFCHENFSVSVTIHPQTMQMKVNFSGLYFSRCYLFRVAACPRFKL